jgi:hypothetical protein
MTSTLVRGANRTYSDVEVLDSSGLVTNLAAIRRMLSALSRNAAIQK